MSPPKKPHILIVDDTPAIIKTLMETLKDDYELSVVIDGEKALAHASTHLPDLILLDIVMPAMDGYEVCQRLKQNKLTRAIPIIFISGKREDTDEIKGLALGAVDYIQKPFSQAIVRARVRTHLELKKHQDQLNELVQEQTHELIKANAQLRVSKNRLERLNHLRASLIGSQGLSAQLAQIAASAVEIFELATAGVWLFNTHAQCPLNCPYAESNHPDLHAAIKGVCDRKGGTALYQCFQLTASAGQDDLLQKMYPRVPAIYDDSGQLTRSIFFANQPRALNPKPADLIFSLHRWPLDTNIAEYAGYLLISNDRDIIGLLGGFSPQPISTETHILMKGLSDTAARVIQTHRAEEAQKESEQRFRAIFDQTFQLMGLSLPDGQLIEVNKTALKFIQTEADQVLGKYLWESRWVNHSEMDQRRIQRAVVDAAKGQFVRFETSVAATDGSLCHIDFSLKPISDSSGQIKLLIAEGRDITELKTAEKQLFRADKLAALGQLMAGIAHEINNPNNLIYFNLPVLKDYLVALKTHCENNPADRQPMNMPLEQFFGDILQLIDDMALGSSRISGIVRDLKNYIQNTNEEIKKSEKIETVIQNVVTLVGKQMHKLVRRFEYHVPDSLPRIHMNAPRIEQVLINLLLNAAQAADKADAFVRLAVTQGKGEMESLQGNESIRISVSDNGKGIPPHLTEKIFDPFFTTKGPDAGTGLGLSISQQIIADHGGKIVVKSVPGEGSRFDVYLPAIPA